jgi:hypothetical protein
MFRGSVLLCALLFSAPSLWQALVDQDVSVDHALIRFLIAIPVAAVLLGLVRYAMRKQQPSDHDRAQAARERRSA